MLKGVENSKGKEQALSCFIYVSIWLFMTDFKIAHAHYNVQTKISQRGIDVLFFAKPILVMV
jgi:hypothetical protein